LQVLKRCEFLRRVDLLSPLTNEQITKLADALESTVFPAGDYIIRQGEQVRLAIERKRTWCYAIFKR
jgi:CRP-like cAMP-binding protein